MEPQALANEIMLNIMQDFKFDFLENEFWTDEVYVLSFISRTLHNIFTGFFSMYRKLIELKSDTRILRRNGLFGNKTCCALTALFAKKKFCFYHCNSGNKQISKNSWYHIFVQTVVNRQNPKYSRKCFQFWKWNPKSMGTY